MKEKHLHTQICACGPKFAGLEEGHGFIMTLNEKLEHFYTSVIDSATAQGIEIVDEYTKALQKIFDERKQAALRKAESTFHIELDGIGREKNRRLSNEGIEIKRKVLEKTEEITNHIFRDVEQSLFSYMKTPDYEELLSKMIKEAHDFSKGQEIMIYINPSDQNLKSRLEEKTGVELIVSNRDFIGGIRAVIPSHSILIDNSFLTKLAEEKSSFKL